MNLSVSIDGKSGTHAVNLSVSLEWEEWDSYSEFEYVPKMGKVDS